MPCEHCPGFVQYFLKRSRSPEFTRGAHVGQRPQGIQKHVGGTLIYWGATFKEQARPGWTTVFTNCCEPARLSRKGKKHGNVGEVRAS